MNIDKKEKKKILLVIVIIQIFGISYLIFSNINKNAIAKIAEQNKELLHDIDKLKPEKDSLFTHAHPKYAFLFDKNYNVEDAVYYSDTTISFFVYNNRIKVAKFCSQYYDCLTQKCKNDIVLTKAKKSIDSLLFKLNKRYRGITYSCYNLVDSSLFYKKDTLLINCKNVYKDFTPYVLNKPAFDDFKSFVRQYRKDSIKIAKKNKRTLLTYKRKLSLRKPYKQKHTRETLSSKQHTFYFECSTFGTISYSFLLREIVTKEFAIK